MAILYYLNPILFLAGGLACFSINSFSTIKIFSMSLLLPFTSFSSLASCNKMSLCVNAYSLSFVNYIPKPGLKLALQYDYFQSTLLNKKNENTKLIKINTTIVHTT